MELKLTFLEWVRLVESLRKFDKKIHTSFNEAIIYQMFIPEFMPKKEGTQDLENT